jgi:hypothetical protein
MIGRFLEFLTENLNAAFGHTTLETRNLSIKSCNLICLWRKMN